MQAGEAEAGRQCAAIFEVRDDPDGLVRVLGAQGDVLHRAAAVHDLPAAAGLPCPGEARMAFTGELRRHLHAVAVVESAHLGGHDHETAVIGDLLLRLLGGLRRSRRLRCGNLGDFDWGLVFFRALAFSLGFALFGAFAFGRRTGLFGAFAFRRKLAFLSAFAFGRELCSFGTFFGQGLFSLRRGGIISREGLLGEGLFLQRLLVRLFGECFFCGGLRFYRLLFCGSSRDFLRVGRLCAFGGSCALLGGGRLSLSNRKVCLLLRIRRVRRLLRRCRRGCRLNLFKHLCNLLQEHLQILFVLRLRISRHREAADQADHQRCRDSPGCILLHQKALLVYGSCKSCGFVLIISTSGYIDSYIAFFKTFIFAS